MKATSRAIIIFSIIFLKLTLVKADEITIAGDPWCPYTCDQKAPLKGYLLDISFKALKKHKVDYKTYAWTRVLDEARSGKIAAAAGAAEQDQEGLIFTKSPLGISKSCFYVKKGNPWKYTDMKSLDQIILGVIGDYAYDDALDVYIEKNKNNPKKVQAVTNDQGVDLNFKKLEAGRIGTFIEDENVVGYWIKENKKEGLFENAGCVGAIGIYVGFSAKNPNAKKYAEELEAGYKELRKSGELKKILDQYGMTDWEK